MSFCACGIALKKNEVKTAVNEALSSLRLSEYGGIVFWGR